MDPPKSDRARRTVHMPAFVVGEMRQHRARQISDRLAAGPAWNGDPAFVFARAADGLPLHGVSVTHRLQRALKKHGLPRQRFHDLRHAAASYILSQGNDMRVVMEVLGHSSITLTANTYSHITGAALRHAAASLDEILNNRPYLENRDRS